MPPSATLGWPLIKAVVYFRHEPHTLKPSFVQYALRSRISHMLIRQAQLDYHCHPLPAAVHRNVFRLRLRGGPASR